MRRRNDEGSTLLLTIFYGALGLLLVLLVVAATSLYLERKRLFTLADGAALVGAEAYDIADAAATASGPLVTLTPAGVAAAVNGYLAAAPVGGFESLAVEHAGTSDGQTAEVTLSAYWRPPVLTLLVPEGLRLEVTATSRTVFY